MSVDSARSTLRRPARRSIAVLAVVATLASSHPAIGQTAQPSAFPGAEASPPSVTPDVEDGKRDFAKGSDRLREGAYEEALAAFVASNRALPSPNTTLLIARCLRELGRLEEAVERFQAAAVDADARVAAGETRYQQAASTARAEGASLRANLGVLHLRLVGAGASSITDLEVDKRRSPIRPDGTVDVLHRPGAVHYQLLEGDGVRAEGRATVSAGRWTTADVVVPAKNAGPNVPAAPPADRAAWLVPSAISASALGLLAFGSFTLFGLESQSTFDDLRDRCAPRCGPADRDAASRGEREQTVANVSLVIGVVALGAGIALGVVALSRRSP